MRDESRSGNAEGRIRLQFLGAFAASSKAGDVTAAISKPKRLALLLWLELSRPHGLHTRDTLCGLLWPESPNDKARSALRQLLLVLRRDLADDVFVTEGELLGINPRRVTSDAGDVLAALERGDDAAAVAAYTGELLPGLPFAEGDHFERWLEQRRIDLRRAVVQAAWREVDRSETRTNGADAVRLAEWACAVDPGDEQGLRRVMQLQVNRGDRGSALQAYQRYTRNLRRDWGADPETATRLLYERIKAGELAAPPQAAAEIKGSAAASPAAPGDAAVVGSQAVTPPPARTRRWLIPAGFAVGGVALVALAVLRPRPGFEPDRVLVVPFQNATGDPGLDAAGVVAAHWVIHGLQRGGHEVVDPATALLSTRGQPGHAPVSMTALRDLARGTSAGLVIVGSVHEAPGGLEYLARLVDVRRAQVLRVLDPIRTGQSDALAGLNELQSRLVSAVAIETDAQVVPVSRVERPPTLDAYRSFLAGLDAFASSNYGTGGAEQFEEAYRRDSTFTLALIWMYYALSNGGQLDSARKVVSRIRDSRDLGIPVVAAWLALDSLERNYVRGTPTDEILETYRKTSRLSPGSHNEWNHAIALIAAGRPIEAAGIYQRFDRGNSWFTRWPAFWRGYSAALHLKGDYRAQLRVAQEYRRRFPGLEEPALLMAFARGARGDVSSCDADVAAHVGRARYGLMPPVAGELVLYCSAELAAHGHEEAAIVLLERWVGWITGRSRPDTSVATRIYEAVFRSYLAAFRSDRALARGARLTFDSIAPLIAEKEVPGVDPRFPRISGRMTAVCLEGDSAEVEQLKALPPESGGEPFEPAIVAICRGDLDAAMRDLETREITHYEHTMPALRPLRHDPRFRERNRPKG